MASIGAYKGVDITGGNQSDIISQINAIDAQQAKPVTPITPQSLEATSPISVPAVALPSGAAGFQGSLEAYSAAGLQNKANADKQKYNQSGTALANALFSSQGETQLQDMLYSQDGGVDNLKVELDDINQQILQEQEGVRREIEAIQDNAEGLTRGAVAGRIDEARRKSLRTQADLSVVQLAKQGRYDSAKAVADRAISVQLEKQKQNIDTLRFIFEESKDMFTKAEERAFLAAQADRERQLENEEYRLRAEYDAKIKQADPMYQLQLADARENLTQTRLQNAKLAGELNNIPIPASTIALSKQQNQITDVNSLVNDAAISTAVGPNKLARGKISVPFTKDGVSFAPSQYSGATQNFIGSVEKLRSQLNLDALIQAKGSGATFGALSDQELRILGTSATKIGQWAIERDGKIVGYDIDEKSFKRELDTINNFAKLDYILKGGDPATVGVNITEDGQMWVRNSDGTITLLQ